MSRSIAGDRDEVDVFARLRVRTVINAYETLSSVGSTRIRPEALDAMNRAAGSFVFMTELQDRVGARIAELSRNESAAVTNGALAGMLLATAACLRSMNSPSERPIALPTGWHRNRVIVQRCQYSPYVPNISQVGAEIVEVGYAQQNTPEYVLESAFDDATAAVFYTAGRPYERFAVPLDRVVAIAHAHDVPVIVDGAALLPPMENLWRFTGMGADLAVFSGGKGLRGPQDSGVVVGRRALVDEIHRMNSPRHGLGRALKTTKEDVVGFLVALESALEEDQAAAYVALQERAERVRAAFDGRPGIRTWILPDGRQGQPCPRTVVQLLPECSWTRSDFMRALADGDPAIIVGDLDEMQDAFYINPRSLTDAEEAVVGRRVVELLDERQHVPPRESRDSSG